MRRRGSLFLVLLAAAAGAFPAAAPAASVEDDCPKAEHPIPLGAAVWTGHFGDPKYKATFVHCFDSLTTENDMKMNAVEPLPGIYDFTKLDEIISFAEANGKRIRGHTLVYEQNPGWVNVLALNRTLGLLFMKDYITRVMTRYRGRIAQYDVVNEAFYGKDLKETVWKRSIGPDYIEEAFRAARAADPSAKLFYNDTGGEEFGTGGKAEAILAMVTDLKSKGLIDGVGLEFHLESDGYSSPDPARVMEVMKAFERLGVAVEITELDVATSPGDTQYDQKAEYEKIAKVCQEAPNCTGLTTWGVSDQYSWRGGPAKALLFSEKPAGNGVTYEPKPAYPAVRALLDTPRPRAAAP